MPKTPIYDGDDGQTDELPALSAPAAHRHSAEWSADDLGGADDTGQHTAVFSAPSLDPAPAPRPAPQVTATVATLTAEVERWSARCRAAEEQLADTRIVVADLDGAIASVRRTLDEHKSAGQRLARELAERTAALHAAEAERTRLREQLEHATAEPSSGSSVPSAALPRATDDHGTVEGLLEAHAALAAYVDQRKQWWDGARLQIANLATKVVALEHELAVRATRLAAAEALAARESDRAADWRAQAADYARQLREQPRLAPPSAREHPGLAPRAPSEVLAPAARTPAPVAPAAAEPAHVASQPLPERTDVVAQLEAEIEYKRHQVAAQLIELHERDERLRAAAHRLENLRIELETARAELETSRAARVALERKLDARDREIAAREARIASLQDDLDQRLAAVQKLSGLDAALQGLEAKIAERLATPIADDAPSAAALLCLTDDAPRRVTLGPAMVFGRAPHCDVQILTHYVSREHARIVLAADGATIEDLGSRNGVFVNAVKVERQRLRQGDLIKIGETEFRYVESMAH